jgi:hypothetical protein
MFCCCPNMPVKLSLGSWPSSSMIYCSVSLLLRMFSLSKMSNSFYYSGGGGGSVSSFSSRSNCYLSYSKLMPCLFLVMRSSAWASYSASICCSPIRMMCSSSSSRSMLPSPTSASIFSTVYYSRSVIIGNGFIILTL